MEPMSVYEALQFVDELVERDNRTIQAMRTLSQEVRRLQDEAGWQRTQTALARLAARDRAGKVKEAPDGK